LINFRYHIVSLMAVFLALAVGIAVGVSLGPSVDRSIVTQADADRQQVTLLRSEIDRRNNLDAYRNTYEQRTATLVLGGQLSGARVAVVTMPDAPGSVVTAVAEAVDQAGGRVVTRVKVNARVFDPAQSVAVDQAVAEVGDAGLTDSMSTATKVGWCLARATASKQMTMRDDAGRAVGRTLSGAGLVDFTADADADEYAQVVIVVTGATSPQPVEAALTTAHVELETAIKEQSGSTDPVGVVVAGPNSLGLSGTDVGAIRATSPASSELSTVDVADLPSGVVTSVLAAKEQMMGEQGHYGALARADDALPAVR
jgi:hypothetical protein